jgi:hypothetical protein
MPGMREKARLSRRAQAEGESVKVASCGFYEITGKTTNDKVDWHQKKKKITYDGHFILQAIILVLVAQ